MTRLASSLLLALVVMFTQCVFHSALTYDSDAPRQVSGFGLSDWTTGETWGEANGNNGYCPSASKGTFYMNNPPCWAIVSSVSSIGDFYVD